MTKEPPDITESAVFYRWWQCREPRERDAVLMQRALDAGLIMESGDMLFLTAKGQELRALSFPKRIKARG